MAQRPAMNEETWEEATRDLHYYDPDMDRCRCGGLVVYFEDGDRNGDFGDGCELANVVFQDLSHKGLGR